MVRRRRVKSVKAMCMRSCRLDIISILHYKRKATFTQEKSRLFYCVSTDCGGFLRSKNLLKKL